MSCNLCQLLCREIILVLSMCNVWVLSNIGLRRQVTHLDFRIRTTLQEQPHKFKISPVCSQVQRSISLCIRQQETWADRYSGRGSHFHPVR